MLTARKEAFALGVFEGKSLSDAYRDAFPQAARWKTTTVHRRASDMIRDAQVVARLEEIKKQAIENSQITADMIVRELARVAFANKKQLVSWGPDGIVLRDSDELTDGEAAAVAEVSETTGRYTQSVRIKTHDKVKALDLLGRYAGLFVDKKQLLGADGSPVDPNFSRPVQIVIEGGPADPQSRDDQGGGSGE